MGGEKGKNKQHITRVEIERKREGVKSYDREKETPDSRDNI